MGEAVVAPGTPDAVRHHDPKKDRQRGPARRFNLGLGGAGSRGDVVSRSPVDLMPNAPVSPSLVGDLACRYHLPSFHLPLLFRRCYGFLVLWRCELCQPVLSVWRASGAATCPCVQAHWPAQGIGNVPVPRRTVQSHPTITIMVLLFETLRCPARQLLEYFTGKGGPACNENFGPRSNFLPIFGAIFGRHAKTCQMGAAWRGDFSRLAVFASCDASSVSRQFRCGERAERRRVRVCKHIGRRRESATFRFLGGQCRSEG